MLLVEGGVVGADERDPPTVLVAHVEDLAVVLGVSVEADGSVAAVEREGQVGEVLPSLRLRECPSIRSARSHEGRSEDSTS